MSSQEKLFEAEPEVELGGFDVAAVAASIAAAAAKNPYLGATARLSFAEQLELEEAVQAAAGTQPTDESVA